MTSQEKFEHLLGELDTFLSDEAFAISEENWGYLDEILKKKDGHLQAMERLRAEVDTRPLGPRMEALSKKEAACAEALQAKMSEAKDARAQLEAVRSRMGKVRQMTRMHSSATGNFQAEA